MEPEPQQSVPNRSVDNPWLVLAVIFLVTGCLGIPLLLVSRGFSTPAKFIWSLASIAYTALLILGVALILQWCWGQIAPALK